MDYAGDSVVAASNKGRVVRFLVGEEGTEVWSHPQGSALIGVDASSDFVISDGRSPAGAGLTLWKFGTDELTHSEHTTLLCVHGRVKRRGGDRIIVGPDGKSVVSTNAPDPKLVRNLVKAFEWREALERGEYKSLQAVAEAAKCTECYVRKLIPLAYLAPDIMVAILDGRQPATLELQHLTNRDIPLDWAEQRRQFGFVA